MAKTALIIQCDIVAKKCVGYACMKSFETRTGKFAGLEEGVNYLSTTCGGCCGMGVAAKLEDLNRKLKRWGDSRMMLRYIWQAALCLIITIIRRARIKNILKR